MSNPCSASVTSGNDEEYGHNNECRAIEVIGQDWSSEVVALFLEDWELARVALSCHMAMNEGRVLGELRVVGSTFFTVITVPVKFSRGTVTATSLSLTVEVGCGEREGK